MSDGNSGKFLGFHQTSGTVGSTDHLSRRIVQASAWTSVLLASLALLTARATALAVILFFGVVVSGCDFNYQPECLKECLAGGGDDAFGLSEREE